MVFSVLCGGEGRKRARRGERKKRSDSGCSAKVTKESARKAGRQVARRRKDALRGNDDTSKAHESGYEREGKVVAASPREQGCRTDKPPVVESLETGAPTFFGVGVVDGKVKVGALAHLVLGDNLLLEVEDGDGSPIERDPRRLALRLELVEHERGSHRLRVLGGDVSRRRRGGFCAADSERAHARGNEADTEVVKVHELCWQPLRL